ncbi:MAG: hypothetical protein Q9217_001334 [Psora testacea]
MGRRKIEIKAIKDDRNRSVTFLKRKGGLFKKAHELSVLCSVDVAVIIFGHNKKLYEYSSGDINDTITRFSYYNGPHEHKGPGDFNGGMDDDDEDDMGSPPLEDSMPRQGSLPPHIQQQSYMRAATSTPPPVTTGVPYHQRQHTPQPQIISRPGSSQAIRRSSTNLGPSHLQQVSQAPSGPNGYTYMRTPPVHNYQAAQGMPAGPHHGQQASGTQHYYNQLQQASQAQQAYMQDQRRQSVPPTFPQQDRQMQQPHQNMPSPPQPDQQRTQDDQSNRLQKPGPAKSRSIFTPIDDSRSLLAQHWGTGRTNADPKPEVKRESESQSRSHMLENVPQQQTDRPMSPPTPSQQEAPVPRRTDSTDLLPPLRTDSAAGAKRPKLKVHIPEEQSEAESATEESSKGQSGSGNVGGTPAKANTEASHSSGTGVVLPPPSPSASAILSAGASGPPNPFARPLPPQGAQQHNNAAFERNRNDSIETPISALPSRFVADGLLPSPSSFYPEWGFGRSGGESANILPSPLNFQTPVMNGASFARDDEADKKRKSPEDDAKECSNIKRVKT